MLVSLAFYIFPLTRLINPVTHKHSCNILYLLKSLLVYLFQLHLCHYNSGKYSSFAEAADKDDGLCLLAVMLDVSILLLSCQPKVTVTSCFIYKVIRG